MNCKQLIARIFSLLLLLSALAPAAQAQKPEFKMHIRLWQHHHEVDTLSNQLLEALKKYPGFCDEVWFYSPYSPSKEVDYSTVSKLKLMGEEMRKLGIVPSFQLISMGHPEASDAPADPGLRWETLTGPDGTAAKQQSCPRRKAFQEDLIRYYTPFIEALQPYGIWVDDDLRLTSHSPVMEACFCDSCITDFNEEYGYGYSRESLVKALRDNAGGGNLRSEWIAFGQESMAMEAAALARAFHKVSPGSRMGLQHVSFYKSFLEGYDWNPIFDAFERETGLVPLSRPGHGYYNDHSPREMLEKGLGICRQINRLNPDITEIAPEIEGYIHKATGKSPHGLCVETMYYLALGATQMSYSIIASANEPMQWYADNYFKALQEWHGFAKEYADFNWGSTPGGLDPYLSPNLPYSDFSEKDGDMGWAYTESGNYAFPLAAIGVPFAPDSKSPAAIMLDAPAVRRMNDGELVTLSLSHGIILDGPAWAALCERGLSDYVHPAEGPGGEASYYVTDEGGRIAVVSYNADITGTQRFQLLKAMDWASGNTLPAIIESMAQAALIPRINRDGSLRSVAIMNCTISEQESYTLRLRTGKKKGSPRFIWKHNGHKDIALKAERDGQDWIVKTPSLEGWNFAWIAVE